MKRAVPFVVVLITAVLASLAASQEKPAAIGDEQAVIHEALSAASADIAKTATVKDWSGNVLKQGSGAYTCYPTPPPMQKMGKAPMCLDEAWQGWADAYLNKKDFKASKVGIAYMLEGDTGASNTDPYATGPTKDNQWVVSGPHTMLLLLNASDLDAFSTDPNNGGPFVMWKGTPYAHVMVPVGKKPSHGAGMDMSH